MEKNLPLAYKIVFDQIMKALDEGVVPWHKPWKSGVPMNAITKRPYNGINPWILGIAPYSDPRWLTYKQAQELGGSVKKGEKSTYVVFWTMIQDKEDENKTFPFLKYFKVFNVEQCENLDIAALDNIRDEIETIDGAEAIVDGYLDKPKIEYIGNQASYSPTLDRVLMPAQEKFDSDPAFYTTLFHELVHSTGHEKRLKRKGIIDNDGFGGTNYSEEELVAEMGAAFLCNIAGVELNVDNSASYIEGWKSKLTACPKLLVSAGSKAGKAVDYIRKVD
jgi:antirestriction protein ArdC